MKIQKFNLGKPITILAKGAIWVSLGMIISRFLGYLIRALIARKYGKEYYGFLSTSLSIMVIAGQITLFGLNTGLARQVAFFGSQDNKTRLTKNLIFSYKFVGILSLLISIILYMGSPQIASYLFGNPLLTPYLKIFSITLPFYIFLELNTTIFKGMKNIVLYTVFRDILRFGLIIVFILIFILKNEPFLLTSSAYLTSYAIIAIASTIIINKKFKILKLLHQPSLKEGIFLLKFSFPLMLSGILGLLLFRIDIILIGVFLDQSHVGIYNIAVPIGQLILILLQAFSPIILPLFTELFATKNMVQLSSLYTLASKWIFLLGTPIYLSILFAPDFYINIIFGKKFLDSSIILQLISTAYFIFIAAGPANNMLVVIGKPKLQMINAAFSLFISILLNVILLPRIGLLGAAISSIISFLSFSILSLIQTYRFLKIQPFKLFYFKFLFAAFLSSTIYLFLERWQANGVLIPLFFISYFFFVWIFKGYDEEDRIVLTAIKKKLGHG